MAKLDKKGKGIVLLMSLDELILLQGIIEKAGSNSARLAAKTRDNTLTHNDALDSMNALWSLSDHLSVPDDETCNYDKTFRLP